MKLEEAASDLDITVAQLENLEDGNINALKIFSFEGINKNMQLI